MKKSFWIQRASGIYLASSSILALVVAYNFFQFSQTFIDVPYRDTWQVIDSALQRSFPFDWFLQPHNEHGIATTKILAWFLYAFDSWNIRTHLFINYALYLGLASVLYVCLRRLVSREFRVLLLLSFLPLFSDLNWENLSWEFQTSFHLAILFSIIAVGFLSLSKLSSYSLIGGSIANLFAVFSLSSSVISSVFIVLGLLTFSPKKERFSPIYLATYFLFLAPVVLWFLLRGEATPVSAPSLSRAIDFLLNLISFGFGFETYSWLIGLLPVAFFAYAQWLLFRSSETPPLALTLLILSISGHLFAITLGRASELEISIWSKGGRYFEVAVLLVPLCAASILCSISKSERAISQKRSLFLYLALCIFVLSGIKDNFSFENLSYIAEQKRAGLKCLENIDTDIKTAKCDSIWGEAITSKRNLSEELQLSFTKKLAKY